MTRQGDQGGQVGQGDQDDQGYHQFSEFVWAWGLCWLQVEDFDPRANGGCGKYGTGSGKGSSWSDLVGVPQRKLCIRMGFMQNLN